MPEEDVDAKTKAGSHAKSLHSTWACSLKPVGRDGKGSRGVVCRVEGWKKTRVSAFKRRWEEQKAGKDEGFS